MAHGYLRKDEARMSRRLIPGLLVAAFSALNGDFALAESLPDVSSVESVAQYLAAQCKDWRVSDGWRGSELRVPLGRPLEDMCDEIAWRVSEHVVELSKADAKWAPGPALAGVCGEVAGRLAGAAGLSRRPVCERWGHVRAGVGFAVAPQPPEDVWNALESPMTIGHFLERRLARDWDQPRVQKEIEALGFVCRMDVVARRSSHFIGWGDNTPPDPPRFVCTAEVLDERGTDLRIFVGVKFTESGEPRWEEINVWTESTF
jgi:hypothetical protein